MTETTKKPNKLDAVIAAQSTARMLDGRSDVPVNPDYLRWNIEQADTDELILNSMYAMLKLLKDGYESLLNDLGIFNSVETLMIYLELINGRIPEAVAKELETVSIKLIPVVEALNLAGKKRDAQEILTCLEGLMTKASYDFAHRLYQVLQITIEMDVVKDELAKTDLEKTYQLFAELVADVLAEEIK